MTRKRVDDNEIINRCKIRELTGKNSKIEIQENSDSKIEIQENSDSNEKQKT